MKTLKYIFGLSLAMLIIGSCSDDENFNYLNTVVAPTNISASFLITQDNSGLVTITPNADGAVSYNIISFGDGTEETAALKQGESVERTYAEGEYIPETDDVKPYIITVEAVGITGLKTIGTALLKVSFKAPLNLVITAVINPSNPFQVDVSATADCAASFEVFFDTSNLEEEPTPLSLDGIEPFEYPAVGDYTIKVIALSGGVETAEKTKVITISVPTELPIDFEIFDSSALSGFDGGVMTVEDNPQIDENNNSATVAQIVKNAGQAWGGNVITMSAPIDFSVKKLVTMDVKSPRPGGKVLFKLENLTNSDIFFETEVTTIGNGDWEKVVFDLSAIDTQDYQKIILIFDNGTEGVGGDDWTFYIDNIKQAVPSTGSFAKLVVEDFEGTPPTLLPFGANTTAQVVTLDDLPSGLGNVTANVAQLIKGAGADTWAGVTLPLAAPLDLDTYSNISVKTWSPKTGAVVKVKLENADASITWEIDMNTTTSDAWEEIVFDFSAAPAADYVKFVIFFDFDVLGDDSVYYFDDITLINTGTPPSVFEDFEGTPPTLLPFGANTTAQVVTLDDLPSGLGNVTANVAQLIKGAGADTWAGVTLPLAAPLDLDTYSNISVKTWSPKTGAVVKVKLENADASITWEVDMNTTTSDAWEEIVFDFSAAPAADYVKAVIFFDFDVLGDGSVYYFDDYTLTD